MDEVKLKRELGLFSATNLIIGTMIGSGIFVSSTSALLYSGSVAMCLLVWIISGLICFLGALVYAELGSVVPRSGGEYVYFMEAFGPLHKFWGPLPGFLYSFVIVLLVRPVELAAIALTSADYLVEMAVKSTCIEDRSVLATAKKAIAILELATMTYINATSVKLYVRIQNICTVLKVLTCLIIIGGGLYELSRGNTANISTGFQGTHFDAKNLALAFYSGLWAYDGWGCVTSVIEEIKKPEVNILRSILLGVPFVTIFYVLINMSYMTVLTVPEIITGGPVALNFAERIFGSYAPIMPLGVAVSAFGCAMAMQFVFARLFYISAEEGHLPKCLSFVDVHRMTPSPAVIIQGVVAILALLVGQILELIEFAAFLLWLGYGFAMICMIILRKTKKDANRPLKAPIWTALLVVLVSIFLSVVPVVLDPSVKYLLALVFLVIGFILYYICVYKRYRPKCMEKITYCVQILRQTTAPTTQEKLLDDKDSVD